MSMHSFETPAGGVMTTLFGAVTGKVVAYNKVVAGQQHVEITYFGSKDRYTVEGSPVAQGIPLSRIVEHLSADPGVDADDNPAFTTLKDFKG